MEPHHVRMHPFGIDRVATYRTRYIAGGLRDGLLQQRLASLVPSAFGPVGPLFAGLPLLPTRLVAAKTAITRMEKSFRCVNLS
jgi:hypothetical protein